MKGNDSKNDSKFFITLVCTRTLLIVTYDKLTWELTCLYLYIYMYICIYIYCIMRMLFSADVAARDGR